MSKTLVSSTFVAAMAATLPSSLFAATTTYTTQSTFEAAANGASLSQSFVEDFEGFTIPFGYVTMGSPWDVRGDGSLTMSASDGGPIFLTKGNYYFPSIPTNAAGTLEGRDTIIAVNGASAVGLDVYGNSTFTAGYFDEILYSVYDTGGGLLASGSFAADGTVGGYFGVVSDDGIGEVHIAGRRFGSLASQDYADNIQVWVPAPGTLAICGGLGLVGLRRRR